jgi:pimeloyl-ACP methyl ester carboxylesterase
MLDLLGFGDSSRPAALSALWADAQAAAVANALDALGISAATVAGHDFGGPTAVHLVAARPDLVARLCICSSNVTADTPIPMPITAITWPVAGRVFEHLLMSRPALSMSIRQATGDAGTRAAIDTGDSSQRRSTRVIFAAALRELAERYEPVEAALRELSVPSLVLWGGRDPFFTVEQGSRTAALIGAELRVYEEARHFAPLECPDEVTDALHVLARLERTAR